MGEKTFPKNSSQTLCLQNEEMTAGNSSSHFLFTDKCCWQGCAFDGWQATASGEYRIQEKCNKNASAKRCIKYKHIHCLYIHAVCFSLFLFIFFHSLFSCIFYQMVFWLGESRKLLLKQWNSHFTVISPYHIPSNHMFASSTNTTWTCSCLHSV